MVTGAVRQGIKCLILTDHGHWHDPWSSPTSLKELYPEFFACSVDKETRISDMVDIAPDGGDRSWNILFFFDK